MGELRYYCSSLGVENVQTSISPLTNLVQPCPLLFTLSTTSVFTKIRPLDLSLSVLRLQKQQKRMPRNVVPKFGKNVRIHQNQQKFLQNSVNFSKVQKFLVINLKTMMFPQISLGDILHPCFLRCSHSNPLELDSKNSSQLEIFRSFDRF